MRYKWPTLKGRLNQLLESRREALQQLKETLPLTELAEKELEKLNKIYLKINKLGKQIQNL